MKLLQGGQFRPAAANEGTYACLAVNEYGSDQREVAVEVYEPAKFVRVPKDVVITSLETVDLDCEVSLDRRLEGVTRATNASVVER